VPAGGGEVRGGADRVLVVGWAAAIADACLERGLHPVLVARAEQLKEVEPPQGASIVEVSDTAHLESVVGALVRNGLADESYLAVHSNSERGMVVSAALGRFLGARAIGWRTAIACRDKTVQKQLVNAAGVRSAHFRVLEPGDDPAARARELAYPLVLKPVAGVAVEHTSVVADEAALLAALQRLAERRGDGHAYLLEEFVAGDEWHVDGAVSGGRLTFVSVGRYADPCIEFPRRGIMREFIFDPKRDEPAYRRAGALLERVLPALGLRDGVFHLEAFDPDGEGDLVFGECAARTGGGLLRRGVEEKHGVNLAALSLEVACGLELDSLRRQGNGCREAGIAYLTGPPGRLRSWPSREAILSRPGVADALVSAHEGMEVRPLPRSTRERQAEVLILADDRERLMRSLIGTEEWFRGQVETTP
jgi:biotin carboxylase